MRNVTIEISPAVALIGACAFFFGATLDPAALHASSVGPLVNFANGTVTDANDINANFGALRTGVNDNAERIVGLEVGGTVEPRWASFNGDGAVSMNASSGVESITRNSAGVYMVNWSTPFPDSSYVVTGSCQSKGNGAKFATEGNNLPGSAYEGTTPSRPLFGCRNSDNAYRDSDLIHVRQQEAQRVS